MGYMRASLNGGWAIHQTAGTLERKILALPVIEFQGPHNNI
jgi:hypothetical protein